MNLFPDSSLSSYTINALHDSGWTPAWVSYDFLASAWFVKLMSPYGQLTFQHQRPSLDLAIIAALSEAATIPPPSYRNPNAPPPQPTIADLI